MRWWFILGGCCWICCWPANAAAAAAGIPDNPKLLRMCALVRGGPVKRLDDGIAETTPPEEVAAIPILLMALLAASTIPYSHFTAW